MREISLSNEPCEKKSKKILPIERLNDFKFLRDEFIKSINKLINKNDSSEVYDVSFLHCQWNDSCYLWIKEVNLGVIQANLSHKWQVFETKSMKIFV